MGQELNKNVFLAQTSSSILHGVLVSAGLLFIWTVFIDFNFQLQAKGPFQAPLSCVQKSAG
jgi:hypothetical protein